eukprot:15472549-Alexandrium_andersonii.AAC.1
MPGPGCSSAVRAERARGKAPRRQTPAAAGQAGQAAPPRTSASTEQARPAGPLVRQTGRCARRRQARAGPP